MKPNDWQDTLSMAASAIEDLLETADEHAGCWADVPARLRALTAPPAPSDAQPVAWLAIYHGEVYDEAISITRSVVEAQADRFGWESALTEIIPLYRHAPSAPVVPDGYCVMPKALTAENGAKYALSGEFKVSRTVTCNECGGDGCNDCGDAGEFEEEITVPWDTIKEIYRAAVGVCGQTYGAPEVGN